ncbi:MAG: methylmalonyl-CoA epimerase [Chlorobi bacterium]|nr:methylmalonyl-CoA epimerase [Chlorobiota bacterium]
MDIKKIEHIGIAVRNLETARTFYEGILGLRCYKTETVEDQKVKTAFYRIGEVKIELLESTDPEGPVARFIEKRGEGIHHLAFKTGELTRTLSELDKKGVRLIDKRPRPGSDQMEIAFLHPSATSGVLIELCKPAGADEDQS